MPCAHCCAGLRADIAFLPEGRLQWEPASAAECPPLLCPSFKDPIIRHDQGRNHIGFEQQISSTWLHPGRRTAVNRGRFGANARFQVNIGFVSRSPPAKELDMSFASNRYCCHACYRKLPRAATRCPWCAHPPPTRTVGAASPVTGPIPRSSKDLRHAV